MPRFRIEVADEQTIVPVDARRLKQAVRRVLAEERITAAVVSIAVVDDEAIRRLNAHYLGHDYATDALSFVLEAGEGRIEGQIIVSAETAAARADEFHWAAEEELLLYVVHAALHLTGYDDAAEAAAAEMRERERRYLSVLGVSVSGRRELRQSAGRLRAAARRD
jgi:probable rRNA maturation factor